MKRIRIGYVPISHDLSAPGDRRRVAFWAKSRGHEIVLDLRESFDVLLLSERSNLSAYKKEASGAPIVFDLVDGYLATESVLHDWFRGTSKVLASQLSGTPKPFTKFVANLCSQSAAVICSSPEQREMILPYSKNVHVILDSHEEIPLLPFVDRSQKSSQAQQILWEGMPATLAGVAQIHKALENLQNRNDGLHLNFVTDPNYYRLLGKFFSGQTSSLLRKSLHGAYESSEIIPWTQSSLVNAAKRSTAAIIPIQLQNKLQYMKPENRLLIMWRLGLPCLTSSSPAYKRVALSAGTDTTCETPEQWEAKLSRVLNDRDFARNVVTRGQAYLAENHNSEILLSKWDQAFQSVL
ncbi:MAG: hypothetical protein Q8L08_06815 [Candidatus Nanopelagicaceae bacterium]|nr:hypothetical protein [Candidatus Nanopelagicaceae bacterium]